MFPLSISPGTYGTISGTIVNGGSAISATIGTTITGTLTGSVGVPGPQGPAGPAGPGLPAGGVEGQIVVKASATDYDTVWVDNSAETLTATVRNETGSTLTKGTVVYISGAAGNKALVSKASASSEAGSSKTFAILKDDILNNQNGVAVTVGLLKGLDTLAFTEGANLWLSTTPGEITQTVPVSPNHAVFLGNVTRVHANQGTIEVRIQNGLELGELHDVLITTPTNGQVLKYDAATSLWKNGLDAGLPAGGTAGQFLQKIDGVDYNTDWVTVNLSNYLVKSNNLSDLTSAPDARTNLGLGTMATATASDYSTTTVANGLYYPLTGNPSGFITSSALTGYATESWVTAGFYPLTGNPSGFITSSALTGYATESWVTSQGYITSAALSPYLLSSTAASTYQTIAGMSSYLTTTAAAATYQTQAAMASYATESWVTSQGYLTDAPSDGNQYARKDGAWDIVSGGGSSYITSVTSPLLVTSGDLSIDLTGYATESWVTSQGYITSVNLYPLTQDLGFDTSSNDGRLLIDGVWDPSASGFPSARMNFGSTTPSSPLNGDFWSNGTKFRYTLGGTTYDIASEAHVSGLLASYAPLASPTFTGTPSLPTGTTAVTQTLGDNSTKVATTAFVQQEVPDFATLAQARTSTNTTTALSPNLSIWQRMSAAFMEISRGSHAYTAVGTMGTAQNAVLGSRFVLGTAGACSGRLRVQGASQNDQSFSMMSKSTLYGINFSKPVYCSGRAWPDSTITDPNVTAGWYFGKSEANGAGNLSRRGFGWEIIGNATTRYMTLVVHNGTTLTKVTSSYVVTGSIFDWDVVSDGAGNVTLYVNGAQVATTALGPTGDTNYSGSRPVIWQEELRATAATSAFSFVFGRGRIYMDL